MILVLKRQVRSNKYTLGVLQVMDDKLDVVAQSYTLELPYRDNMNGISCIPAGVYPCVKSTSTRLGEVIRVGKTKHRVGILIHKGNYLRELRGCVLTGNFYVANVDYTDVSIMQSSIAYENIAKNLPFSFDLHIINAV